MTKVRTLVVEDEAGIRFFINQTLTRAGHVVTEAVDGEAALTLLRDQEFDLVMLDLHLGGRVDGLRVLEALRWRWPDTVAIILTAHGSLETAMQAIHEHVDRYLLKPVTPEELRATVHDALTRRAHRKTRLQEQANVPEILRSGAFQLDLDKHRVVYAGRELELTLSEFNLLAHLVQNEHRVVPPRELVEVVREYKPEDLYEARNIIKWYIHRLRRTVEPTPEQPRHILNVRGVGYRFEG